MDEINKITATDQPKIPTGIGLCLSGGGYRAMLFHVGTLWRLNESGYLPKLDRISSVSGGSITSAVLGLNWHRLEFDATGRSKLFAKLIVEPVCKFAQVSIDVRSVVDGLLSRGNASDKIAKAYDTHLFGGATLQDLPDSPRFVINASNVQSGVLWRFMKPYMRDYRVGEVKNPTVSLALAVAASSAFPPILSPARLKLKDSDFTPNTGQDLQFPPFTTNVVLSDGGVYDNLGLETVWKRCRTILVSDAGRKLQPEASPKANWGSHVYRVLHIIDSQVRSLRQRHLLDCVKSDNQQVAYWGIRTDIKEYPAKNKLQCPRENTLKLAEIPTRLAAIDDVTQKRLINWGYAVTDAAIRSYISEPIANPKGFPFEVGV